MSKVGPGAPPPMPRTDNFNVGEARTGEAFGLPQMEGPEHSQASQKLSELNGILDNLGLGTLGGDVTPVSVQRGDASTSPNPNGEVRERATPVKDFFKKVGSGIKSFFSKVGHAISGAATKVGDFFKARFARAEPPIITQQEQRNLRNDALKNMAQQFEARYQEAIQDVPLEEVPSRADFLAELMPAPEGGADALDVNSPLYMGGQVSDIRENIGRIGTADQFHMFDAMMDVFEEMPSMSIAIDAMMDKEIDVLDNNPGSFLRGNSAYSKTEKLLARSLIPFSEMTANALEGAKQIFVDNADLARIGDVGIAMESLTPEQGAVLQEAANGVLDKLLDIDPETEGSFFNSIPQEFKDFLADQAGSIMSNEDLTGEQRQDAVEKLYVNAFFLRSSVGDMIANIASTPFKNSGSKTLGVKTMQLTQTFLNGVTDYTKKGNENSQAALDSLWDNHGESLTNFFHAVGMPEFE